MVATVVPQIQICDRLVHQKRQTAFWTKEFTGIVESFRFEIEESAAVKPEPHLKDGNTFDRFPTCVID